MALGKNLYYFPNQKRQPYVYRRTIGGNLIQRRFRTLEDARAFKQKIEREFYEAGHFGFSIRRSDLKKWNEITELCSPADPLDVARAWHEMAVRCGNVNPLDAIRQWQRHFGSVDAQTFEKSFCEWCDWLRARERAGAYIEECERLRKKLMQSFPPNVLLADITSRKITDWLFATAKERHLSPKSQRNLKGMLSSFFGWCVASGKLTNEAKPEIAGRLLPAVKKKAVATFTAEEAERAMNIIAEKFSDAVPHFALRLFAGIRRDEALRMRWQWINFDRKQILVPAYYEGKQVCKTKDDWLLIAPDMLPETVFEWLKPYAAASGLIWTPQSRYTFEKISDALGNPEQNVFRHTFATMHLGLTRSALKTMEVTRHTSLRTFRNHYQGINVSAAEAERFWKMRPSKNDE